MAKIPTKQALGTVALAGAMLVALDSGAQPPEMCGPLRNVVGHVGAGFEPLRGSAYGTGETKLFDATTSLPQAKECWISDGKSGPHYWCSWPPAGPAVKDELKAYADSVVKCFPQATAEPGSEDTWWVSLPDTTRFYLNYDSSTKTIDIAIYRRQ